MSLYIGFCMTSFLCGEMGTSLYPKKVYGMGSIWARLVWISGWLVPNELSLCALCIISEAKKVLIKKKLEMVYFNFAYQIWNIKHNYIFGKGWGFISGQGHPYRIIVWTGFLVRIKDIKILLLGELWMQPIWGVLCDIKSC